MSDGPRTTAPEVVPTGILVRDRQTERRTWAAPAHPVTVIDPVGAGDAFDAALTGQTDIER